MNTDTAARLTVVAILIGAVALGVWLWVRNYRECRVHGFTRIYCLTVRR